MTAKKNETKVPAILPDVTYAQNCFWLEFLNGNIRLLNDLWQRLQEFANQEFPITQEDPSFRKIRNELINASGFVDVSKKHLLKALTEVQRLLMRIEAIKKINPVGLDVLGAYDFGEDSDSIDEGGDIS